MPLIVSILKISCRQSIGLSLGGKPRMAIFLPLNCPNPHFRHRNRWLSRRRLPSRTQGKRRSIRFAKTAFARRRPVGRAEEAKLQELLRARCHRHDSYRALQFRSRLASSNTCLRTIGFFFIVADQHLLHALPSIRCKIGAH